MNTQDQDKDAWDQGAHGEEALRWQLRGLRREIEPQRDLWPGIAATLAAAPQVVVASRPARNRRFVPWAMAASVLLAAGLFWQIQPPVHQGDDESGYRQQALSMTRDYEQALAQLQQAGTHPEMHAAFGELDRSVDQILAAIAHDPDAPFLLEQLRRTYARRLQLTQRAVIS